jgi:hypothetical protein
MSETKKMEIELSIEEYKKFKLLCDLTNTQMKDKVKTLIDEAVYSAEISNF